VFMSGESLLWKPAVFYGLSIVEIICMVIRILRILS
jgi:hypothetical protein